MTLKFTTLKGNELIVKPKAIIAITPHDEKIVLNKEGLQCRAGVVVLEGGKTFEVQESYEDVKELFMMYS